MADQASLPPEFPIKALYATFDQNSQPTGAGITNLTPLNPSEWGFVIEVIIPPQYAPGNVARVMLFIPFTTEIIRALFRDMSAEEKLDIARALGLDDDAVKSLIGAY